MHQVCPWKEKTNLEAIMENGVNPGGFEALISNTGFIFIIVK